MAYYLETRNDETILPDHNKFKWINKRNNCNKNTFIEIRGPCAKAD